MGIRYSITALAAATGRTITQLVRQLQAVISGLGRGESEAGFRHLFMNNPHPMWVYDLETLQFLEVNEAAIENYGYTRDEFMQMQITDIRPSDELPRLMEDLAQKRPNLQKSGPWRHQLKDGRIREVEVTSHTLEFNGRVAALVVAKDVTKQNETLRALRKSEERFRQVVESTPNAMVIVNQAGEILLVNSQMEEMFGYHRSQLMGQSIEILLPPRFRQGHVGFREAYFKELSARMMGTGRELFALRSDGSEVPVEIGLSPMQTENEVLVLAAIVDITPRRQLDEQLRARILQQAAVVRIGQQALASNDLSRLMDDLVKLVAETIQVDYCKVLEHLLAQKRFLLRAGVGWRAGLVGQATVEDGLDSQAGYTLLNRAPVIVTDLPTEHRFRGTPLLGEHSVISGVSVIIEGEQRPFGVLSVHTRQARLFTEDDVHFLQAVANVLATAIERRRSEERVAFLAEASNLLVSSLSYAANLERVAHMMVPYLADWCLVYIQEPDSELAPLTAVHRDADKLPWLKRLQAAHWALPAQAVRDAGASPKLYPFMTAAEAATDESHLELLQQVGIHSLMVVPLMARAQTLGVMALARAEAESPYHMKDLALAEELAIRAATAVENARLFQESRALNSELERRVKERTKQLEATNQELEAFAYSVSHDLRAPLRAMDGFSRILMEDFQAHLPEEATGYLQRVRFNAQQMGDLIDGLLSFSRLSREPVQKQPVLPAELVQYALQNLQVEQAERDMEIIVYPLPPCQADPRLLQQVFANLLHNAFKYTRQQSPARIEVGWQKEKAGGAYFVKDNGIGFDMQYGHKAFGVFQRLHPADVYEGTGIGLATVQRIIHRHGGRIWAEAAVDAGATFYFTLGGKDDEPETGRDSAS